jgi:integrase
MGSPPQPVEYAVAVERFLAESPLSSGSRRVYRFALTGWTWSLAGQLPPAGTHRRSARPPVLPLALLDRDEARARLAAAVAHRAGAAQARTVNRELSALRSAIAWWLRQGWICTDPTSGLGQLARPAACAAPLSYGELAAIFALQAPLREQSLWHLLHDTGVSAGTALALDGGSAHLSAGRQLVIEGTLTTLSPVTAQLLGWLLAGRRHGPVFLTGRRAPAGSRAADVCPVTGSARLSYRRAAEIFTDSTRPLDPAGHGWVLHQLRRPRAG